MNPAEELATAADKLDALASEASDGPWILAKHKDGRILGIDAHDGYDEVITTGDVNCMAYCYGGTSTIEAIDADWRYIAAMNPLVGKALAEYLRGAGHRLSSRSDDYQAVLADRGVLFDAYYGHALALARLINGGVS